MLKILHHPVVAVEAGALGTMMKDLHHFERGAINGGVAPTLLPLDRGAGSAPRLDHRDRDVVRVAARGQASERRERLRGAVARGDGDRVR